MIRKVDDAMRIRCYRAATNISHIIFKFGCLYLKADDINVFLFSKERKLWANKINLLVVGSVDVSQVYC